MACRSRRLLDRRLNNTLFSPTLPPTQKKMIYLQLGPPPPVTAPARLHLHYAFLHRVRSRSHVVDAVNAMVDGTAMLIVKLIFCWCLGRPNGLDSMSMRLMFTPFWYASVSNPASNVPVSSVRHEAS